MCALRKRKFSAAQEKDPGEKFQTDVQQGMRATTGTDRRLEDNRPTEPGEEETQ
ncbi:MAG: hypothetical protein WA871_01130 [Candidatus Acidiferrales bacterium]